MAENDEKQDLKQKASEVAHVMRDKAKSFYYGEFENKGLKKKKMLDIYLYLLYMMQSKI